MRETPTEGAWRGRGDGRGDSCDVWVFMTDGSDAEQVKKWMEDKYTLRYTGGLVPDVYQCVVLCWGHICYHMCLSC